MKTWMWTRTVCSVVAFSLISVGVGCQDKPTPPAGGGTQAPAKTDPPAKAAGGSGLNGGVDVPPPVQPDATEKPADAKPAEGDKPAAEGEKPAAEGEKPAEEAKPTEEKKSE